MDVAFIGDPEGYIKECSGNWCLSPLCPIEGTRERMFL